MLKKFTAVVAILFIVSSVVLTYVSIQEYASLRMQFQTVRQTKEL